MSTFEDAILTVLKHEGGYVNHKNDPGGATNFGVSLRFLKSTGQLSEYDFDDDGDIDADDIRIMTKEHASNIYKTHWWDKYDYSRLHAQAVATKVFDMSVNMGHRQAVKLLQRAIVRITGSTAIAVDGVLGPRTINAANEISETRLVEILRSEQADFYQKLIDQNSKFAVFEKGWMKRAYA